MLRDDRGSSPVEFVLVGLLLTAVTLGILQFALVVYVRNVVQDAAIEGAYHAALADVPTGDGAARAVAIVDRTLGTGFVESASAVERGSGATRRIEVTVVAAFPLIGLFGVPGGWEVIGHAPVESWE